MTAPLLSFDYDPENQPWALQALARSVNESSFRA